MVPPPPPPIKKNPSEGDLKAAAHEQFRWSAALQHSGTFVFGGGAGAGGVGGGGVLPANVFCFCLGGGGFLMIPMRESCLDCDSYCVLLPPLSLSSCALGCLVGFSRLGAPGLCQTSQPCLVSEVLMHPLDEMDASYCFLMGLCQNEDYRVLQGVGNPKP